MRWFTTHDGVMINLDRLTHVKPFTQPRSLLVYFAATDRCEQAFYIMRDADVDAFLRALERA